MVDGFVMFHTPTVFNYIMTKESCPSSFRLDIARFTNLLKSFKKKHLGNET